MIAQVNTPRQRQRFLNACRGKLCCGATLPLALQLLGKAQPGRFFAGPTLALDIGGRTAWAAGHANPEELASFLNFCGCRAVILDEAECPPPVGWQKTCDHTIFGLAAGEQLPLPAQTEAQKALWDSLTFVEDPASGPVAENLFPDRPARRRKICSRTGLPGGMIFTRSSAPSAAGARHWSGPWSRAGTSSARWEPTPFATGRPTWPAARPPKLSGASGSAGGSSSRWPTPSPRRGISPFSSAAPSGCIFTHNSASTRLAPLRVTKARLERIKIFKHVNAEPFL